MENKNGKLLIVFLIITIILIIVMGVIIYMQNMQKIEADLQITELENNGTTKATELDVNDNMVRKLIKKIDFPTYAVASIYNERRFDLNTISNDLILRLGWTNVEKQWVKNNIDNIGEYKQTAAEKNLEKSIINIFGNKVKFSHESFTNTDVEIFYGYEENQGEINYSNNLYTANYIEGGGGDMPFIHQEIKEVLKYDNRIMIYVNTAFIDTKYIDNDKGGYFEYIIYKDYINGMFEEKICTTTSEEFIKYYLDDESNGEISLKFNAQIAGLSNKLNTYVYEFELDNATGEYYLSKFYARSNLRPSGFNAL